MPADGTATKTRILDSAQELILEQGYAATSLDQILRRAETTKGSFFYHFKSKADLALALIRRFAAADTRLLQETLARAEKLTGDPLQQILLLVGLYEEMFADSGEPPAGCLFASYSYEKNLMTEEVRAEISSAIGQATALIEGKLREAAERHPPRVDVDFRSLADLWTTLWEGAFVMQRTITERELILDQLRHFRTYVALLFSAPDAWRVRR